MKPQPLSTKRNNKTIVLKQQNPTTRDKFQYAIHLLLGRYTCIVPMLWQMHNANERWFLFYQIFEISFQLAILFIFFSFPFSFFLYTIYYWFLLLSFVHLWACTSAECPFDWINLYIDFVDINQYQVKLKIYASPKNFNILDKKHISQTL